MLAFLATGLSVAPRRIPIFPWWWWGLLSVDVHIWHDIVEIGHCERASTIYHGANEDADLVQKNFT